MGEEAPTQISYTTWQKEIERSPILANGEEIPLNVVEEAMKDVGNFFEFVEARRRLIEKALTR